MAQAPPAQVINQASVSGQHPDTEPDNDAAQEGTTLDAEAPEVGIVVTDGDTLLEGCATARSEVRSIRVHFSEPMNQTPGSSGSVIEPSNYLLVSARPGQGFDTETCFGGTGEDRVLEIGSVTYEPDAPSVSLQLSGSRSQAAGLGNGLYRLLVCGTVTDLAGNALDGDEGPGSDRRTTFRVDRFNALETGHFDRFDVACDLESWQSTGPQQVQSDSRDFEGSPLSGSVSGVDQTVGFDVTQCVELSGDRPVDANAAVRIEANAGAAIGVIMAVTFFADLECTGPLLDEIFVAQLVIEGSGGWIPLVAETVSPSATRSARYSVVLDAPSEDPFDGAVDAAYLGGAGLLFQDGFETGDLTHWSTSSP